MNNVIKYTFQINNSYYNISIVLGGEDLDVKPSLGQRQKKTKKDKEKLSSTTAAVTNDVRFKYNCHYNQ